MANMQEEIQKEINKFVTGSFRFGKEMCTMPVKKGRLGMINVSNYITSLHCSWVKRSHREDTDNWRSDLRQFTGDKITNLESSNISIFHPVLKNLSESFKIFKKSFISRGKNFFCSTLYGNPCLINNRREKIEVGSTILHKAGTDPDHGLLSGIKISEITTDGSNFINREQLSTLCITDFTAFEYNNIVNSVRDSWCLIKKTQQEEQVNALSIDDFLRKFKKGSKPFRRILDFDRCQKIELKKNQRVKTFFRL
jgi:hypothetical protein